MKHVAHVLMGLSLLVICTGCVAAAVGAGAGAGVGTYAYIKGELQTTYSTPIEQSWPKTLVAMQRPETDHRPQADGCPWGRYRRPAGCWHTGESPAQASRCYSTTIGVRVGTIGSKSKAEIIHQAIQRRIEGS